MFERLSPDARLAVTRAHDEATALGSATIEAEHLLLALAHVRPGAAAALLDDAGLTPEELHAALERADEQSLAAVGVTAGDFAPRSRRPLPRRDARLATSTKRALERALRTAAAHGDRRLDGPHLLIGVLLADVGTVPRTLAAAGVDRIALMTRAQRLLG